MTVDPSLTLSGWLRYDIVRRWLRALPVQTILEIGPGVGALGVRLARSYDYVGVEMDSRSAEIAAERLARVGQGEIVAGKPEDIRGAFDVVCAFEVLEHIENDAEALIAWRDKVRPNGSLILSVPAWESHWGAHDEHAGHVRRYEREGLQALLREAGYCDAKVLTYGFPLLSALHPLSNKLSARVPQEPTLDARTRASGRFRQPPFWLGPATAALATPFALLQRPFLRTDLGTGFVALARRA